MGNDIRKDSSSDLNATVSQEKWEDVYNKMVSEANITGATWEELAEKLAKHIEDTSLIEKEWEFLQRKDDLITRNEFLFTSALQSANKGKNRYLNILPYDTTRVRLSQIENNSSTDYINANWVKSAERTYICTQAPLEHTVDDFYRMLWETKAKTIVMLTRFAELGRIKAHDYLPKVGEGKTKYGEIEAECTAEEPSKDDTYVVRRVTLTKGTETQTLVQFHFIAWPDHGVPDISDPILDMAVLADQTTPSQDTPTVVHCSAGVGRTGTYVIINSILEPITNHMKTNPNVPPTINMAKTLHDLRSMRAGLVNHIDQYEFCYKCILAHIQHLIKQRNEKNEGKTEEKKT